MRREFAGYTIIAVDHHLENILDFDKIAGFDTGMLVEFEAPEELLGRGSACRELYGRRSVGEVKEI
jgi:ATP-binding cassette subfamily C (CFTR/MRP) protein 1